jgi:hypothetical protein
MPINKIEMNDNQVKLAKQWLAEGCEPYGYNNKMIWYWEIHYSGVPIKNGMKLSPEQVEQLNQLL